MSTCSLSEFRNAITGRRGVDIVFGFDEFFPLSGSEGKFCQISSGGRAPHNRTGLAQQPLLLIVSGVSWQRDVEKLTVGRKTVSLKRLPAPLQHTN